jgi:hypothetical protein
VTSSHNNFWDFIQMIKRLESGKPVLFQKPYPTEGNPQAFYLGQLTKRGLLSRNSFPAHTEYRLRKGQKLTKAIRGKA